MFCENEVRLMGYVGQRPELRYTQSGKPVCNFSMATSYKYNEKDVTTWHSIVIWGASAEFFGKNVDKGDFVQIKGELQENSWTTKEGKTAKKIEVKAWVAQLIKKKGDRIEYNVNTREDTQAPESYRYEAQKDKIQTTDNYPDKMEELPPIPERDGDIPF